MNRIGVIFIIETFSFNCFRSAPSQNESPRTDSLRISLKHTWSSSVSLYPNDDRLASSILPGQPVYHITPLLYYMLAYGRRPKMTELRSEIYILINKCCAYVNVCCGLVQSLIKYKVSAYRLDTATEWMYVCVHMSWPRRLRIARHSCFVMSLRKRVHTSQIATDYIPICIKYIFGRIPHVLYRMSAHDATHLSNISGTSQKRHSSHDFAYTYG